MINVQRLNDSGEIDISIFLRYSLVPETFKKAS